MSDLYSWQCSIVWSWRAAHDLKRWVCSAVFLLQVVHVEGPSVAMGAPYIAMPAGDEGVVQIPLELTGSNMLLVAANLSLSWHTLGPGARPHQ